MHVNNSTSGSFKACSLKVCPDLHCMREMCDEQYHKKLAKDRSSPIAAGEVCDRTLQVVIPHTTEQSVDATIVTQAYELRQAIPCLGPRTSLLHYPCTS